MREKETSVRTGRDTLRGNLMRYGMLTESFQKGQDGCIKNIKGF